MNTESIYGITFNYLYNYLDSYFEERYFFLNLEKWKFLLFIGYKTIVFIYNWVG